MLEQTDPLKLRHALESMGCGQSTGFDTGGLLTELETVFLTSFQEMPVLLVQEPCRVARPYPWCLKQGNWAQPRNAELEWDNGPNLIMQESSSGSAFENPLRLLRLPEINEQMTQMEP